MRAYELVLIVESELDDEAFNEVVERVQGWVVDAGGKVTKTDHWGRRELAYPIRKKNEGNYLLMELEMDPTFGAELERNLNYQEPVMRHLLVGK